MSWSDHEWFPGIRGFRLFGCAGVEEVGAGAGDPAANGADRAPDRHGGLLVRQPDELREDERFTPIRIERLQQFVDLVP